MMNTSKRNTPITPGIYLCAPINALVEGIYEENIPFSEIKRHGDFGLGTFNDLDGEMVMLDNQVYRLASSGAVEEIRDDALMTPFACVTFFEPLSKDRSDQRMEYALFLEWLDTLMPSPNIFYAFRIEGEFSYVKTRSVPRQECYRPLVEVTRDQPVFEFDDIQGTLAGFYTPSFMTSINVPGIHLHFLSRERDRGGHLLECHTRTISAEVQMIYTMELSLPKSLAYLTQELDRDIKKDLDQAEK